LYDDLSGEYADIVASQINTLCYGLEFDAEYRFADHFRATAAFSLGRYQYSDNAVITIYSDTSNILLADHIKSHTKGLSLGNAPQIVFTAGLSYYNRGWWAAINANYACLRFVEPSSIMRTERVLAMATSPEQRSALLQQERLRDAFTIDASLSKSLYIRRMSKRIYSTSAAPRFEDKFPRIRLIFRVGVRNLLGSTNIVYNAYESSRLQRYKIAGVYVYNRQATRYMYAYPRTFYASATFAF
jgi:outer membrane receptor protein involved in Fe transport